MPEILKKQYGPLPLWAWLLVVAASLGLSYIINRQGGIAAITGSDNVESVPPQVPVMENVGNVPGVGVGGGGFTYVVPPDAPEPDTPTTNQEWASMVIDQLIANGYEPRLVDQAIRKYISVEPLNKAEQSIVDIALAKFGPPPQVLPPVRGDEPQPTPSGPANVEIFVERNRGISVTWSPVDNATNYRITLQGIGGVRHRTSRYTTSADRLVYFRSFPAGSKVNVTVQAKVNDVWSEGTTEVAFIPKGGGSGLPKGQDWASIN